MLPSFRSSEEHGDAESWKLPTFTARREALALARSFVGKKEGRNEHDFGQGAASQQASASLGQVQPEFDIAFEVERANLPEMRFV